MQKNKIVTRICFDASRLGEIPAGFYDRSRVTIHSAYAGQIMQILVNDDHR